MAGQSFLLSIDVQAVLANVIRHVASAHVLVIGVACRLGEKWLLVDGLVCQGVASEFEGIVGAFIPSIVKSVHEDLSCKSSVVEVASLLAMPTYRHMDIPVHNST